MDRLKSILVAVSKDVDCSLVLEKAHVLAAAADAATLIVRVVHDDVVESGIGSESDMQRLKAFIMESEEAFLEELIAPFEDRFGTLESVTIWNKRQWQGIIDAARDVDADLIIKVANLEPRIQAVIHTPDDWNLLRHSTCPVMLLKPQPWEEEPAIVAAVDILSDDHMAMNRMVLEKAGGLTRALEGTLNIVNAYPLFEPWVGELGAGYNYDEIKQNIETELKEKIVAVTAELGLEYAGVHVREGKPSMVIRDLVEESHADIVVMGTVGRSGVAGLVIGNTSESVLHVVNTDVVTLRLR